MSVRWVRSAQTAAALMKNDSPGVSTRLALNVDEAAAALHISPRMVRKLIASRGVPVVRIGRRVLLPCGGLAEWIRSRTEVPE